MYKKPPCLGQWPLPKYVVQYSCGFFVHVTMTLNFTSMCRTWYVLRTPDGSVWADNMQNFYYTVKFNTWTSDMLTTSSRVQCASFFVHRISFNIFLTVSYYQLAVHTIYVSSWLILHWHPQSYLYSELLDYCVFL